MLCDQEVRLGGVMCDKYLVTCLDQLIPTEETCKCENAAGWMIHSVLGPNSLLTSMGFGSDPELPADLQIVVLLSVYGREWAS